MTTTRAAALVIGALLGPSLLLVPGLAAAVAGPASIVDWVALLALSGLLAWVFTALGRRVRTGGGVAGYVEAGLGRTAGRIVAWCFLAGVVAGAPVVCLVGGGYVAAAAGRGSGTTVLVAAVLLATVVLMAATRARSASSSVQLALVAALVVLVALAVIGSMPAAQLVHWTPFAPHGLRSIGAAAPVLMFSFMGWEIMAAVVGGLRDVDRQLPRVVAISFTVTAVLYLALAVATIGVLGPAAAGAAPLAALLEVALGPVGGVVAAVAAVVLTLAAVNAYLTGAAEFAAELRPGTDRRVLPGVVAVVGAVVLAVVALGGLTLAALVAVPVTLLLAVYLGCTVAGVRLLTGPVRIASAVAAVATGVVMACSGPAVLGLLVVAAAVAVTGRRSPRRQPTVSPSSTTSPTSTCSARRTATLSGTR